MTNKEIGKAVGVSKNYISKVINGQSDASGRLANMLMRLFRTDIDTWIVGSKDERLKAVRDLRKEIDEELETYRNHLLQRHYARLKRLKCN